MEIRNPPRPPLWRDPAYLRAQRRQRRWRPLLAVLSLLCGLFLLLPPEGRYDQAISFQLAQGPPTAWALFLCMGLLLAYVAVRLWMWEGRLAALGAVTMALALATIAFTNPLSQTHNDVFLVLSFLVVLANALLFYTHLDLRLLPPALGALASLFVCLASLGLGERLLIASSCVSLNVLYYGHLDP